MDDGTLAPTRHKIDVDTYHRMGEAGLFGPEERIELIDGDLIDMAPIGMAHAAIVIVLTEALVLACAGRAFVSPQNPVHLGRNDEPQPDIAILRRRADVYATGSGPGPADILLLIEVADSSLSFDRTIKLPRYARLGIGELWIVDVKKQLLDAYTGPSDDGFAHRKTHSPGETLALALAPEIVIQLKLPSASISGAGS